MTLQGALIPILENLFSGALSLRRAVGTSGIFRYVGPNVVRREDVAISLRASPFYILDSWRFGLDGD